MSLAARIRTTRSRPVGTTYPAREGRNSCEFRYAENERVGRALVSTYIWPLRGNGMSSRRDQMSLASRIRTTRFRPVGTS
jgi:hypothetical protein